MTKKINPVLRLIMFIIGMAGAVIMLVYSIRWEDIPIAFTLGGYNITVYAISGLLVMGGFAFHSLIKSGILGEYKLD